MFKAWFSKLSGNAGNRREAPLKSEAASLPSVIFDDAGTTKTLFTLPPTKRPDLPSTLAFAAPKSGSVMLDGILRRLTDHIGLSYVSIMEAYFNIGLQQGPPETAAIFLPAGYCYGGFREYPRQFEIPILRDSQTILLVRDVRDMLVSHFFSMRHSHPTPGETLKSANYSVPERELSHALEIDAYVKHISQAYKTYLGDYCSLCREKEVRIYRYEDVIYDKRSWIEDMVGHFGWDVPGELVAQIAAHHDVIPSQECEFEHIRQVHPGNHRTKLQAETITWLNDCFREEMAFFGYDVDAREKNGKRSQDDV